ncbi:helix-turn-helix transcriptional regulator [Geodermatophilus sp. SYSU D00815]
MSAHADSPRLPDRRRVDAREHLRAALASFDELGAVSYAERAAAELRASGEAARRRDVTTATDLSPQERQVTALVRQGLPTRDVAAQMFVSPRTVDFHLRNIFAKPGVASRAELTALPLDAWARSSRDYASAVGALLAGLRETAGAIDRPGLRWATSAPQTVDGAAAQALPAR